MAEEPKAAPRRRHTTGYKLETMAKDLLKVGAEYWSKGETAKANECKVLSDALVALSK